MISRFTRVFLAVSVLLLLTITLFLNTPTRTYFDPWSGVQLGEGGVEHRHGVDGLDLEGLMKGKVVMGKLGNETAKAELGRAAWKVLHLVTLRFPDKPTSDERDALRTFFHLFARLYPCGECAQEFQDLLREYPPQTSSRKTASLWLCYVHNLVNDRLHKPAFDCTKLDEAYDCGCGDAESTSTGSASPKSALVEGVSRDEMTNEELLKGGIGI